MIKITSIIFKELRANDHKIIMIYWRVARFVSKKEMSLSSHHISLFPLPPKAGLHWFFPLPITHLQDNLCHQMFNIPPGYMFSSFCFLLNISCARMVSFLKWGKLFKGWLPDSVFCAPTTHEHTGPVYKHGFNWNHSNTATGRATTTEWGLFP